MRESRRFSWSLAMCSFLACRSGPPTGAQQAWPHDEGTAVAGAPADEARPSPGDGSMSNEGEPVGGAQGGDASALDPGGPDTQLDCGGEPVTLAEVHSGRVRRGARIAVEPVVASSQKFLVSEAKSGSCLWGAMAAHPTHVGRGSGLFLVSFGEPHADGAPCQPGGDGLPDDLATGDVLQVEGTLDEFVPAACEGVAPTMQLRIEAACAARRTARVEAPAAALLDTATATAIAAGKSAELLRDWSAALVRLEHVSALRDEEDGDAVFPYGVMRLEQTMLEVHSRIYYFDLSGGGPRSPAKAPRFDYPALLARVTGHIFLDYCTWALGPRSACADFEPAADGCSG